MILRKSTRSGKILRRLSRYFFEFLMLFLAVSLGFFVENQRDATAERQEELRLMKALYNDLEADVSRIDNIIKLRTERNAKNDSLQALLFAPDAESHVDEINRLALGAGGKGTLFYKSNSMNFLASEGFYKISSAPVANATREYNVQIEDLLAAQESSLEIAQGFREIIYRVLDSRSISAGSGKPSSFFDNSPAIINEVSNRLRHINNNNFAQVQFAERLRDGATSLMNEIEKAYDLKID